MNVQLDVLTITITDNTITAQLYCSEYRTIDGLNT